MCDVHLIEEINEERSALKAIRCSSCKRTIMKGARYQHVEGHLDDGSPGRWVYAAHEDCYTYDCYEVNEDGCFTWTGAERISV